MDRRAFLYGSGQAVLSGWLANNTGLLSKSPGSGPLHAAMGGLHTTSVDYAKFLIEVLKPADAYRLNKSNHDEMLTPQIRLKEGEKVDDADAWALGWAIRQRTTGDIILHSGGQSGFRSLTMGSLQQKSGFIMLTNSDNGGNVLFHPELAAVLHPLFIK
jgi:hypothetical protein